MEQMLTEGVPKVDLLTLPSLAELFGGALNTMWRRNLAQVLASIRDTSTDPAVERSLSYTIVFVPDADRRSASYQLAKAAARTPGPRSPSTSRMTFLSNAGALEIYDRSPAQSTSPDPGASSLGMVDVNELPGLEELWGGGLDERFKRCLIQIILNIDDPATSPQAKRAFELEIGFKADDDRLSLAYRLKKCHSKTAPPKSPSASRMYLDTGSDGRMSCALTDHHPGQMSLGQGAEAAN